MRNLLSSLKIDEEIFAKNVNELLMDDYANFDTRIENLLSSMCKIKSVHKEDIINLFKRIELINFDDYLKILNK